MVNLKGDFEIELKTLWVDEDGKAILCRENIKSREKVWVHIMYLGSSNVSAKLETWYLGRNDEMGPKGIQGQTVKDLVCHSGVYSLFVCLFF